MARDIAADTLAVGNAMASVRIDQMILNLAKGIAWGQYELDKVGVEITRMMGVPGTVSIGGEQLSMLDAGFIPSFYHFVDTILEIKMEVNIREEQSTSIAIKESVSRSAEMKSYGEVGVKAKADFFVGSVEASAKAGFEAKSSSAYSRTLDASHAQKFSQDLSATSLMRTKIVPVPPPELLVERIKILLERLRNEAQEEEAAQVLFRLPADPNNEGYLTAQNTASLKDAMNLAGNLSITELTTITTVTEGARWTVTGKATINNAQDQPVSYFIEKAGTDLKVYQGTAEQRRSMGDILMEKVEDKLFERLESR